MNENTLISVHGYSGDGHQIKYLMPYYLHHKCPVVILSPVDYPVIPEQLGSPSVQYIYSGLRAYIGPLSLDRQKQHLHELIKLPFDFFLMNDSDSFCLSPVLPPYLFAEDIFWSHEASDLMHEVPAGWPYPRFACQPPFFCSKSILERLVKAAGAVTFESCRMQYIDHYMMRLLFQGGIPHKTFPRGCSCPTHNAAGKTHMIDQIKHGGVMLHSVKTKDVIELAVQTYKSIL